MPNERELGDLMANAPLEQPESYLETLRNRTVNGANSAGTFTNSPLKIAQKSNDTTLFEQLQSFKASKQAIDELIKNGMSENEAKKIIYSEEL